MKLISLLILPILLMSIELKAHAAIDLVDPAIPNNTEFTYKVEMPGNKFNFESKTLVTVIKTTEGEAYLLTARATEGTKESDNATRMVYQKDPFRPLSYVSHSYYPPENLYYYKAISWDWENKTYDYEEIFKNNKKDQHEKYTGTWTDDPYLDLVLIYGGLLNGLPINEEKDQTSFRLFLSRGSAKVTFKKIKKELIFAAGKNWECYKIEAIPDLGIFLNFLKFIMGNPKSYVWLTTTSPKIVVNTHIKTPWYELIVNLDKYKTR